MKQTIIICTLLFAILSGARAAEGIIQQPDPKKIQRFEWHLFPKPESVKKRGQKVIVVFDRKQWESFQYMHRKMWMRRGEVKKQIENLKQRPNNWK